MAATDVTLILYLKNLKYSKYKRAHVYKNTIYHTLFRSMTWDWLE